MRPEHQRLPVWDSAAVAAWGAVARSNPSIAVANMTSGRGKTSGGRTYFTS
jgi:hypothetical protein